jgi:flagellar export protein FliJ
MKKFRFTLQTVHDLRQQTQRQAELALLAARKVITEAMGKLEEARHALEAEMELYRRMFQSGQLDQHKAALRFEYLNVLQARIHAAEEIVVECQRQYTLKQVALVKASIAAEITTRLRDAQSQRHRAEYQRTQQVLLDEMAVLNAARKRQEQS